MLAVVIGAGIMVMITHTPSNEAPSSPTPTHTYPKEYPEEKLPAQIGEYKLNLDGPAVYEILRGSDNDPNRLDVKKSKRIGIADEGIPFREGGAKGYARHKETDELEPGVYCDRDERRGTHCYAASNSGRIWKTTDHFKTLTREQLASWTTHFLTIVKE